MNFYNWKISFNNLLKNKLTTSLNIGGLSLGIAISLLIFSYVRKEKTMDQFIPDIENTFVLLNDDDTNTSAKMAELVRNEIPEISHITYAQYEWSPQIFIEHMNTDFKVDDLVIADSAFFRVFQFESVYGNPANALLEANKIVLTQTLARKIFGNENPVGKTIKYNATNLQNVIVEVGAVIKDLPHNCSWEFDAVLSIQTNYKIKWYNNILKLWGTKNFYSFFRTSKNVNPDLIQKKLENISLSEVPEKNKNDIQLGMFPFVKAYCDLPDVEILKHGSHLTINIIQITGLLILLLACINYINLVTAQKLKRLQSIGILKVLGSKRGKIFQLISTESTLVLLLTVIIVFVLVFFLLDGLNQLTNSHFTILEIFSGWNLIVFLSILIFTLLVTGIIPGIVFGKNQTTQLLKNSISSNNKSYIRDGLLIFQFSISIVLISSILLISKQNNFLNNLNPGFKKENIIYTFTNDQIKKKINAFNNEIKKIPGVDDLTFCSAPLGYNGENWGVSLLNNGEDQQIYLAVLFVSPNFFDFFGLELVRGTYFNDYSDKNADWILNQTAINEFNINQLDNAKILDWDKTQENIIAEVKDFNFESMHVPIRAAGFKSAGNIDEIAYLKLNTTNGKAYNQCLASIHNVWNKLSPDFPLEIEILNTSWEYLYDKEKQFQNILNYATIISIVLSCLGLISLTFFLVETHTKEIGIRKVNGAKTFEIIKLLNVGLIKLLGISFILASPIAYYSMNKWLQNFAYKTELSWWIFALAGIIAMGIALLTVSWQSLRAARRNPVESLRYE